MLAKDSGKLFNCDKLEDEASMVLPEFQLLVLLRSFAGIVDSVIAAGNEMSNLHMQMCKSIMAQVDPALRDTRALDDALRVVSFVQHQTTGNHRN